MIGSVQVQLQAVLRYPTAPRNLVPQAFSEAKSGAETVIPMVDPEGPPVCLAP